MSGNGISNIDIEKFFINKFLVMRKMMILKKAIWEYTHQITLQNM